MYPEAGVQKQAGHKLALRANPKRSTSQQPELKLRLMLW